jgi:glucose-1-phosphate cytidylyltransferase
MKVIILAGGLGTRLQEESTIRPKPMVEIGGRPIIWHIMNIYAAQGFKEFVVALGYKGEIIKDYFYNYGHLHNGLSVSLRSRQVEVHNGDCEDWLIHLVDTGPRTETGGRLKRLSRWVGTEPFLMTYGDGLADIDLGELLAFHRRHGKLATVSAVRPPARFGALNLEGDAVTFFEEKPQTREGWINGGFFVLEPGVLEEIEDDNSAWERGPLDSLARKGQLMAYRHDGFWHCMDTLRDVLSLEQMWAEGRALWKIW